MGTQTASTESEFNALQFEKILTNLKDSQENINNCCQWCLQNRQHHKKIVTSWLNVLKRVKVEQRLILFYLANDVVQYSKRRNYEYVESWGTAIQKATTMVRDERVKHKILRIFKIWEQRGVYGEEFIADLCGLISVQPTGPKSDEPHEFQASYVVHKIKNCANLEKDTDRKLKVLKEHNPKIQIVEGLINSLKDRAHVDDVEKELDVYVQHMENYINALKLEIKNRIALISVLKQAETQLEADRKDVKLVAHAYKTFGQRVKVFQKKLEEHMETLPSPIPSPDINAPSPSPDSDLDLPEEVPVNTTTKGTEENSADNSIDLSATIQFTNPGYYNPVPPPTLDSPNVTVSAVNTSANSSMNDSNLSFLSNGFTSFLGQNLSFDITNISATGLFTSTENSAINTTQTTNSYVTTPTDMIQPPMPVEAPSVSSNNDISTVYNPLLPPPMPPFSKNNEDGGFSFNTSLDTNSNFGGSYQSAMSTYSEPTYTTDAHYDYQLQTGSNPYAPEENYDPSDIPTTWENVDNPPWNDMKEIDTPESPPLFEKKGYRDPVEYHDTSLQIGAADVDHRILPGLGDLDDSLGSLGGGKDVDHRNLISLTGSPNVDNILMNGSNPPAPLSERGNLKTITPQETLWDHADQDYRNLNPALSEQTSFEPSSSQDQDYRLQFNLDNLNIPPPPPPPKSPEKGVNPPPLPPPLPQLLDPKGRNKSPRKGDIVENVDMDLSDDIEAAGLLEGEGHLSLEPPPPLPDLLDDVDANQFLDDISNDLNEFSNLSAELNPLENENNLHVNSSENLEHTDDTSHNLISPNDASTWQQGPPPMSFSMGPPGGLISGVNRMDMNNAPPNAALLAPPMMNGPPIAQMPPPPSWMDGPHPPWASQSALPPFEDNFYMSDDNINNFDYNDHHMPGAFNFGGLRNRGGVNNFRGGFIKTDNFGFRGRGRGGRGVINRGRGMVRGGRGVGFFRPRGNFRGGFNRGGF